MSSEDSDSTDNTGDSVRPRFTLLSTTPGNRIMKQREYHHHWCIPSKLADMIFDDPVMLLVMLNTIFGTTYSFRATPEALGNMMNYCISRGYDLGMAYGMLRPWWNRIFELDLLSHFESLEREDRERRERAVSGGLVVDSHIPPRRVWDLYCNRVLPFWVAHAFDDLFTFSLNMIMTVSHAWMSPDERKAVTTPINGNKWPVPIPKDISLDDLRIELLNLRVKEQTQYVWLDVLCLRQVGGEAREESLRAKEWGIDVPTIGAIYWNSMTAVYYLNGLGRPFEENDLDDTRHWCNRAWTMQELGCAGNVSLNMPIEFAIFLGGITEQSPCFDIAAPRVPCTNDYVRRLGERVIELTETDFSNDIIKAAALMSRRQAERELDKLAGLVYLACGDTQPVFDTTQDVEDAWLPFVDCLTSEARWRLFFLFLVAGDGKYKWTPSWNQLLQGAQELKKYTAGVGYKLWWAGYCPELLDNGYSCLAVCLPHCRLHEFDSSPPVVEPSSHRKECRATGTVTFKLPETDDEITFQLTARHSHSIPSDRTYCLLSDGYLSEWKERHNTGTCCRYWAVGSLDEQGRFHKETVLEFDDINSDDVTVKTRQALFEVLGLSWGDNETNKWVRRVELA